MLVCSQKPCCWTGSQRRGGKTSRSLCSFSGETVQWHNSAPGPGLPSTPHLPTGLSLFVWPIVTKENGRSPHPHVMLLVFECSILRFRAWNVFFFSQTVSDVHDSNGEQEVRGALAWRLLQEKDIKRKSPHLAGVDHRSLTPFEALSSKMLAPLKLLLLFSSRRTNSNQWKEEANFRVKEQLAGS